MFNLGMTEVIVLLVIALLLFGNRLPSLARWLGKTITEFRREASVLTDDLRGPTR